MHAMHFYTLDTAPSATSYCSIKIFIRYNMKVKTVETYVTYVSTVLTFML